MPITSFTIAGVEVDPILSGYEIRETTGNVSTLTCDLDSTGSPVYRPSVHEEVIVQEDGGRIFGGTITQVRERGHGGPNLYDADTGAPQIVTTITAEDHTRLAARITVTETVTAGTLLKAFLTTLITDYLSTLGISLDAAQVDGPALPEMSFDHTPGSDVLQALTEATGYLSRVDYNKQLRMWLPGDLAAPFDIDENDDPAPWTGDVEVERILGDDYANRVIVIGDEITEYGHLEEWTGDGVTTTFTLEYHPFAWRVVTVGGNSYQTVTTPEFAGTAMWILDLAANTITRDLSVFPELGIPELGESIEFNIDGTFTPEATAEDAGEIALYGLYEVVVRSSEVKTTSAAQALADAILAERLHAGDQIVTYQTRQSAPTLRAGQQQTISASARDVLGDYLITDLQVQAETPATTDFAAAGLGLIRRVTAKRNQIAGKWQQTYHDWLSDTKGGTTVQTGGGGGGSVSPGGPNKAVQYNRNGIFGGEGEFTYDEATNCVVCGGGGSDITATGPESCQVFGFNNHIADP